MKKMNKTYEAPMAEMIEIQMPAVLMASNYTQGHGNQATDGGEGGE